MFSLNNKSRLQRQREQQMQIQRSQSLSKVIAKSQPTSVVKPVPKPQPTQVVKPTQVEKIQNKEISQNVKLHKEIINKKIIEIQNANNEKNNQKDNELENITLSKKKFPKKMIV